MIEIYVDRDATTVCRPWGDLNSHTSAAFRQAAYDALLPAGGGVVVVDLSRVPAIDAEGLSALLGCMRRARTMGATLHIRNARPQVRERLDLVTLGDRVSIDLAISGHDVA